jgi:hypothetical protein
MSDCCKCYVLLGRGLCGELTTCPEESYRLGLSLSVIKRPLEWGSHGPRWTAAQCKKIFAFYHRRCVYYSTAAYMLRTKILCSLLENIHFSFVSQRIAVCSCNKSFNLLVTRCTNNCTLCPLCIYVLCIWERTATFATYTYSINWLVFITEMKSVYSAVRTGSLNKAVCAPSLKG